MPRPYQYDELDKIDKEMASARGKYLMLKLITDDPWKNVSSERRIDERPLMDLAQEMALELDMKIREVGGIGLGEK